MSNEAVEGIDPDFENEYEEIELNTPLFVTTIGDKILEAESEEELESLYQKYLKDLENGTLPGYNHQ